MGASSTPIPTQLLRFSPNHLVREVKGRTADQARKIRLATGNLNIVEVSPGWISAERFAGGEETTITRMNTSYIETPMKVILPPRWWVLKLDKAGKPTNSHRIFLELEPNGADPKLIAWPFGNGHGPHGVICWGDNVNVEGLPIVLDNLFFNTPFTDDYLMVPRLKNLHKAAVERYSKEGIEERGRPAYPVLKLSAVIEGMAEGVF